MFLPRINKVGNWVDFDYDGDVDGVMAKLTKEGKMWQVKEDLP